VSDDVSRTLARWAERDAAIGLDAELHEVRIASAAHAAEIVDLRARTEHLAQRVSQLVTERDALARQVAVLGRPPLARRINRLARAVARRSVSAVARRT
jgi:hypothetical protein